MEFPVSRIDAIPRWDGVPRLAAWLGEVSKEAALAAEVRLPVDRHVDLSVLEPLTMRRPYESALSQLVVDASRLRGS